MKKYDVRSCAILEKHKITDDIYDVTVDAGDLAQIARPGQFAQIYVPGKTLRRPISICGIDTEKNTLRFVFQVRGEGTAILAGFQPGDSLNLLAPLGNGFDLGDTSRRALFVGGGIGVPPLLAAAAPFGKNAVLAAGFRGKESIILKDDFEASGCKVLIATDDGSYGHHGLVTELLDGLEYDVIFACGPKPMLRAVCGLAEERGIPCLVSLEERMACGIGACLGCAVKLRGENGEYYGHVCKDGPVFDSRRVVW
ncbi:MAG TPA: dihydroorotate dehydrogenase electron transfer subunit [Caproicibacter sp.]|nr:dihydroorotate dehydrogenase electron transfer subunit [Caproicibacter sp.]